ncbi:MAG: hypothetical protein Q8M03_04940 [Legionella sp.]|nr:hypothetical protein [Legionella sp.]
MNTLLLGYDDNLGLPDDFITIPLKTKAYHDIKQLLHDFETNKLPLVFVPAGTLPYLTSYSMIAQATFGLQQALHLTSVLVNKKKMSLSEIVSSQFGRVNQYCTTSFWAPLIYFMEKSVSTNFINFIDTKGFQDLLFKVADQSIDTAMVWDIILQDNPEATQRVEELGSKNDLPTPLILSKLPIAETLKNSIINFKSSDKKSFFNGFKAVDVDLINNFRERIMSAIKHFHLKLN